MFRAGREEHVLAFRIGAGQLARKDRLFRILSRDNDLLEAVAINFRDEIGNGDGTFLDWIGNAFKWIIENQDTVLAFIKALIALFGAFSVASNMTKAA